MAKTVLGIIGGSGVYQIEGLENAKWQAVKSPWGQPSDELLTGTYHGVDLVFLPRHGRGHIQTPTSINYRANIDALKRVGVTDVISVSACGSLGPAIATSSAHAQGRSGIQRPIARVGGLNMRHSTAGLRLSCETGHTCK